MVILLSIAGLALALHLASTVYNAVDYRPMDLGQDMPSPDHVDATDGGWQIAPIVGCDY